MSQISDLKFRPIRYPNFFEYWKLAKRNPWNVFELDFLGDKQDWRTRLSAKEQNAIIRSLTAFTQAEQIVGDYWTLRVATSFKVPEIIMMARAFGDQECTHFYAYNYTEEILDLDTFNDFVGNEIARKKIEELIDKEINASSLDSLAIFSGAVEGVSLFSSFLILLSFCKDNKMPSIKRILGWSVVDEELHSIAGIELFNTFKTRENFNVTRVLEGFDAVIKNEEAFIDFILQDGDLPTIKRDEVISYLHLRANQKLQDLGLLEYGHEFYEVKNKEAAIAHNQFINSFTKGKVHGDFFTGKISDGYTASIIQNFMEINYDKKTNVFNEYAAAKIM